MFICLDLKKKRRKIHSALLLLLRTTRGSHIEFGSITECKYGLDASSNCCSTPFPSFHSIRFSMLNVFVCNNVRTQIHMQIFSKYITHWVVYPFCSQCCYSRLLCLFQVSPHREFIHFHSRIHTHVYTHTYMHADQQW